MKALFTADLHLTTRPQDEYRWVFLDWLMIQATHRVVDAIFILGDLTDAKDMHSAALVNRLVTSIGKLSEVAPVYVLKGNHDYIDASNPFFKFLARLEGVRYYTDVREREVSGHKCLFLPHTKHSRKDWEGISLKGYHFICCHQPFLGAVGDNGHILPDGSNPKFFDPEFTDAYVLSGDIHTPQAIRNITYIGAPYPIHFGDHFTPRVLMYEGEPGAGSIKEIKRTTIRKLMLTVGSIEEFTNLELHEDDQVRVKVSLLRSEFPDWPRIRDAVATHCEKNKIGLYGMTLEEIKRERVRIDEDGHSQRIVARPSEVLERYGKAFQIDQPLLDVGLSLLKDG